MMTPTGSFVKKLVAVSVGCLLLLTASPFLAHVESSDYADWPTFHFDESRTGNTTELLKAETLLEKWRYQSSSSISSSPVIKDNIVYVNADNRKLCALDGDTGTKLWETDQYLNYPLSLGSPTIQENRIYFVTGGSSEQPSFLYCYSTNGTLLWKFVAFGQITSNSALAYGSKIFFGSSTDLLYCVNESGSQIWQYGLNGPILSSPCLGAGRVFAVTNKGRVYAFDYNDYKNLFELDLPLTTYGEVKASPVFMDGMLYVATRSANEKGEVFAINAYTGEIIWRSGNVGNFTSTPAVNDKYIFIGSEEGTFYCVQRSDGKVKWKYSTKNKIIGSPAITGDYVIIGGNDGFVYVFQQDTGEVRYSASLGNEIITSPIISNHKLILTYSNVCVALADNIDFTVETDTPSVSMYQTEETSLNITINSTSPLSQNVYLRMEKVPVGLETLITPNIVKITDNVGKAKLKITASKDMKPGTYQMVISAETNNRIRKCAVTVEILAISEGNFEINFIPTTGEVYAGNALVFQVQVSTPDTFSGSVILSMLNPPSGFTCTFSENRVLVPGYTNLVILVDITADPGRYSFAVTGKGGGKSVVNRFSIDVKGTKRTDWLGFGNGNRLTNYTEEAVNPNLELRYTFQADGAIRSTPAIAGDIAYFTAEKTSPTKYHSTRLYAIDTRTGIKKWDYYLGSSNKILPEIGAETDEDPPPWISSPRIEGNKLLVGTLDGIVFCFDRSDGRVIWYKNVGSSIRSSPCVADNKVIIGTENSKLYGLDLESGEQRWVTELKGAVYSSPAYYKNRIYISCYDNYVYAVSPVNGLIITSFNGFRSSFKASPVIGEEALYIGGAGQNKFFYKVGLSDLQQDWQILTADQIPSTAAIDPDEKFVYYIAVSENAAVPLAQLVKVRVENKEKIWGYSAGGSDMTTSPVLANDKIIFTSMDKNLHVVGSDGNMLFKYQLDAKCQGNPAVGRGVVMVGTNNGSLYCFSSSVGFTLIPSTPLVTMFQGSTSALDINVFTDMPLKQALKLTIENLPTGMTYEFSPTEMREFPGKFKLTLVASDRVPTGKYKIIVSGQSGTIRRNTEFELRIQNTSPGRFALRMDDVTKEINAGTIVNHELWIDPSGGFNAPVTLSVKETLPQGVEITFNPKITTAPGKSVVYFRIAPQVENQTFTVTLRGDGGGRYAELALTVTVFETLEGDFSLVVHPTKQEIYIGEKAVFEIFCDSFGGFKETVALSISTLPKDYTYSFSKDTMIAGDTVQLVIETTQQTTPGTIKFDIKGKAFKTEKKVPIELIVGIELGDFSLNINSNLQLTGTAGESLILRFTPTCSPSWNAPVQISVLNAPASVTTKITPALIEQGQMEKEVAIEFQINQSADGGIFSIQIQGLGGGKIRTYHIKLQILSIKDGFISLKLNPPVPQIKKDKETVLDVVVENAKDLVYIELVFSWDPGYLKVLEIVPGPFLADEKGLPELVAEINHEKGTAVVKLFKKQSTGSSGTGNLFSVKITGLQKGVAKISAEQIVAKNSKLDSVAAKGFTAEAIVTLYLAGDINGDGTVNMDDLIIFSRAFGSKIGDANFDKRADFNNDGLVDGVDLILLAYNWGEVLP